MASDDTWKFSYNSSIIDFMIVNDDNESDKRNAAPRLKPLPNKTISEDLMDFLASEDLCTKTPTSVTFKSIEDPLPSYEGNFATLTNDYNEQKTVTNEQSGELARLATLRTHKKPFSPSDVLNKPIKQEPAETDPILNFNSLKDCLPSKDTPVKREKQEINIDQFFQKENSMSISVNDMSSIVEEGSGFLDGFSPVSPASSEGSTDTLLSSGVSDVETSPRRGSSPLKKTRRRKVTEGGNCPHLWQFILELLGDKTHAQVISWTGVEYHFKVHNSRELARLWGTRKNKPRMNFDKLSRAMRYYYDKNIIRHISGQRLVYEFCRNNEDTVYSKLLKDAARTMPQKPLVSLSTAAKPTYSPPAYSYMTQEKCAAYQPPVTQHVQTSAAQQPGFSTPSYAQLYNTALYNATERYVSPDTATSTEYHMAPHQAGAPSYIPHYNYNQSLNINVQVGGGYNKERLGYSYSHYTPY